MLLTVNRLGSTNISLRRSGRRRRRRSRAVSGIDPRTLARASGTCHVGAPRPGNRPLAPAGPGRPGALVAAVARFGGAEKGVAGAQVHASATPADRTHVIGEVAAEPVPQERRGRQLRDPHAGTAIPLETVLVGARR